MWQSPTLPHWSPVEPDRTYKRASTHTSCLQASRSYFTDLCRIWPNEDIMRISPSKMILQLWLVVSTPLKNIGRLGLFFPYNMYIYIWKKSKCFQKPPTSISGTHYYHQLSIGHHMPLISIVFQRICWVSIVFLPWLYQWTIMVCLRIRSPQSWWFFLGWEGHFLTLVNI